MVKAARTVVLYPGSFDPVTMGHIDVVERCLKIFSRVIVAVLRNPQKEPLFSLRERIAMIRAARRWPRRFSAEAFGGLLVDFAKRKRASILVRGLREISDFEYEFQMALMNRRLAPHIETVFMMPKRDYTYLSSRLVKEIAFLGGSVRGLVPAVVARALRKKYAKQ